MGMYVPCWNCGQDVWIETQKECRHCGEMARRCVDCVNYAAADSVCRELGVDVSRTEAQRPTRLSMAFNCPSYTLSPQALNRQPQRAEAARPAPATPAAQATRAPATPDEVEVITIVREPALRRPQRPVVIAHRGDSAVAPANTLAAFRSALASGAQAVEFDIHITRDGQAVVAHDATVDGCSSGTGTIQDLTLAELKALDFGSWFSARFAGERMPTLDEAIEAMPAPALLVMHLRAHENESDRCERAVADAIARHNLRSRAIVTHHTRHGLHRLRELEPKLRLCWIGPGGEPGCEYIDDAYYMGYRFVQPIVRDIDEKLVAYAHERGMWINAFWADEVEDMRRLIKLGVDGIITNYPARLVETLQQTPAGP